MQKNMKFMFKKLHMKAHSEAGLEEIFQNLIHLNLLIVVMDSIISLFLMFIWQEKQLEKQLILCKIKSY